MSVHRHRQCVSCWFSLQIRTETIPHGTTSILLRWSATTIVYSVENLGGSGDPASPNRRSRAARQTATTLCQPIAASIEELAAIGTLGALTAPPIRGGARSGGELPELRRRADEPQHDYTRHRYRVVARQSLHSAPDSRRHEGFRAVPVYADAAPG